MNADDLNRLATIPESELIIPVAGAEYYEGRTEGWDWFGVRRWWETFIVWDNGFNGVGQPAFRRLWRLNGNAEVVRTDYGVYLDPPELLALANPSAGPPQAAGEGEAGHE